MTPMAQIVPVTSAKSVSICGLASIGIIYAARQSNDVTVRPAWCHSLTMPVESPDPQTYAILGAAMQVHRELGPGLHEAAYREALEFAFATRSIPFATEVPFRIRFDGRVLTTRYRADFVCYEAVIVELKALKALTGTEMAQVLNYLKVSGLTRGLLLNFGTPSLEYRRLVLSQPRPSTTPAKSV